MARLKLASQAAALVGGSPIELVNAALLTRTRRVAPLLRAFGAEVGEEATIHGPLCIHNAGADYANLHIGRRAHVGRGVTLDLTHPIVIEEEATVSMGVTILTHADVGARRLARRYPRIERTTRIGSGAYVGANVTILAGCDIGPRAVVGAGAVVTEPIGAGTVAVGVPAKVRSNGGPNSDELDCSPPQPDLSSRERRKAGREA